jgi:hypothetical protein
MFVFGSNPSDLAGQRNWYDQTNISLAKDDRDARQNAIQRYQNQLVEARRQAEQDARQDQVMQFNYDQLASNDAARQEQTKTNAFQFGAGQQDKAAALAENKRQFDTSETRLNKQFDFNQGQSKTIDANNQLKELIGMFKSDSVPADSDVTQLFPALTDAQKNYARQVAEQQKKFESDRINSAAEQATHLVRQLGGVAAAVPNTRWFGGLGVFNNAKDAVQLNADKAFSTLNGDKELREWASDLIWDDVGQRFVAKSKSGANDFSSFRAMFPPAALAPPSGPSPADGAGFFQRMIQQATPMNVPAPVTPTAGGPGGGSVYPFVQPAAANPAPVQMSRGYQVGATYKGGLRYLGGDPNNLASWQQVGQ